MKDVILPKYFLGNTEDLESEAAGPRSFLAPDKSKFSLLEWINDGIEDGRINADISASISDGSKGDIIVFSNGNLWELVDLGISPGTYISANVTVDSKGRVTAISNGSSSVASGIGVTPTIDLTSTNVQAALEELQSDINSLSVTGNAVDISFTPTGNTTSTNVQAAIVEIQTELDAINIPATYPASAITVTPSGNLTSVSVQNALQELQTDIDSIIGAANDGNGIYDGNGILPSNVTVDAATHSFVMDDLSQVNFILSDLSSMAWSNPGSLSIVINGEAGIGFSDNRGIIYNGDYSANFISRSLVDKAYVDSQVSSISAPTTASELPFVATGNTTSTDVQSAIVELQTELDSLASETADGNGIYDGGGLISSTTTATISGGADLNFELGSGSDFNVSTSSNSVEFIVNAGSNIIEFGSTTATAFFDSAGFTYNNATIANLEGGDFLPNSLVHKSYVDNEISSISVPANASELTSSAVGNLTSTNVQAALEELQANIDSITIPSTYAATNITVTPSGNLGSTDVQAALVELQTELDNLVIPSTASELPFVPNGSIVATNVQNAINEVQGDINGIVSNPSYTMNLYETNGTLSANRTITADGNSLTITGLSAAGMSVNSGTKTVAFSGVNGWAYLDDYSVDFTARSLVDKAYVDNNAYTDSDVETYISANVTYSNIETLTPSAGVVSWTGQESNVYDFTMTANTQVGNPSNPITGAEYTFIARVSSGGPYTISFGTNWKFQGVAPAPALSAGHRAVVKAVYDGTDLLAYRDRLYTT